MKVAAVYILVAAQPVVASGGAQPQVKNPYFYTVTSKAGKISYILGTVHIGVGIDQLPSYVLRAFENTSIHYGEDIGVFDPPSEGELLIGSFHDPVLFAQEWRKSEGHREGGTPLTETQKVRLMRFGFPRYIADALIYESSCGLFVYRDFAFKSRAHMLDSELGRLSVQLGKTVRELESEADLAKAEAYAARKAPRSSNQTEAEGSEEECMVGATLDDDKATQELLAELEESSIVKNVIAPYMQGLPSAYDEDVDHELDYRNRAWVRKLVPELNNGGVFVFVGSAHLRRPTGVVALLKAQGFTVVRTNQAP